MKLSSLFTLLSCLCIIGCDKFTSNDSSQRFQDIENRISKIETILKEWTTPDEANLYLRTKDKANVRTSPEKGENIMGMLLPDNYVQRLETNKDWHRIRFSADQQAYEGYIHKSQVESVEIGEKEYFLRSSNNHFTKKVKPLIVEQFQKFNIGTSGLATIGIKIIVETSSRRDITDKIMHFFVNINANRYQIREIESESFEDNAPLDCIVIVTIRNDHEQLIKILKRDQSIIFHQFVDFNYIE